MQTDRRHHLFKLTNDFAARKRNRTSSIPAEHSNAREHPHRISQHAWSVIGISGLLR